MRDVADVARLAGQDAGLLRQPRRRVVRRGARPRQGPLDPAARATTGRSSCPDERRPIWTCSRTRRLPIPLRAAATASLQRTLVLLDDLLIAPLDLGDAGSGDHPDRSDDDPALELSAQPARAAGRGRADRDLVAGRRAGGRHRRPAPGRRAVRTRTVDGARGGCRGGPAVGTAARPGPSGPSCRPTRADLADALASDTVVHVAAHGSHVRQNPMFSSLAADRRSAVRVRDRQPAGRPARGAVGLRARARRPPDPVTRRWADQGAAASRGPVRGGRGRTGGRRAGRQGDGRLPRPAGRRRRLGQRAGRRDGEPATTRRSSASAPPGAPSRRPADPDAPAVRTDRCAVPPGSRLWGLVRLGRLRLTTRGRQLVVSGAVSRAAQAACGAATRAARLRGPQADLAIDLGHRPARHLAGLLGAPRQDRLELGPLAEQLQGPLPVRDRRGRTPPRPRPSSGRRSRGRRSPSTSWSIEVAGQRGQDGQQVRDTGLVPPRRR